MLTRNLLLALAFLSAFSVQAQRFYSTLRGADVVPPSGITAVGTADLTLSSNVLNYVVFVPTLGSNGVSGAVYGPARAGVNSTNVVFQLAPFTNAQRGATSGQQSSGSVTLTTNQVLQLRANSLYLQVSDAVNRSALLRGQIIRGARPVVFSSINGRAGVLLCPRRFGNSISDDHHGCASIPLRARIYVLRGGQVIATGASDLNGNYQVRVPSGDYTVIAQFPDFPGQRATRQVSVADFSSSSADLFLLFSE